jgi:hypothetical protein
MAFAIKAEVRDPRAKTFAFTAQKTMYGGKHIAEGDRVFVFASENEGGQQTPHGLERRPAWDRAQFQILSSGNEQDRWHHECGRGIPR